MNAMRNAGLTSETDTAQEPALLLLTTLPTNDPTRILIREDIIHAYHPMARRLANRFTGRGEDRDDLEQVAMIGLIKAVAGYDPTRGARFSHYAVPTIIGELKRHVRDKGWSLRVPRRLQELHLEINRLTPHLAQQLGRTPTITDIATHLHTTEEDIATGIACAAAYHTRSLNITVQSEDGDTELAELIGEHDLRLETVSDRHALRQLLTTLPTRERRILNLRFFHNLTQAEIATTIGVSQMHVSRLLTRSLNTLRQQMTAEV
jgi:RNA polymerase sigma-B factor